jgi:hypothetical protein
MKQYCDRPYAEGDIFNIEGKEYNLRLINQHDLCWLEPIQFKTKECIITGGMNKCYKYHELNKLKYTGLSCI